jgi:predicted nucleic-acid-binding protein
MADLDGRLFPVTGQKNHCRQERADFSEYLIGYQNRAAGCMDTATFDEKLRDQEGFALI